MPDTEGPDKKVPNQREFMREKIVKRPLTRRQIALRVAVFLFSAAAFGAVASCSFIITRPWAEKKWGAGEERESSSIQFDKDDPDVQQEAPDASQPQENGSEAVPVEAAVDSYMETYEFSADDLKAMYENVRKVGQQADKGIVTVHSGKQQMDLFGNPIEMSGYCAGAVIARTSGEYVILTRSVAVENADSINVVFFDGTETAGTVLQTDEVMGMAVIRVDAGLLDEETRKEIHVIPLGNSYSMKTGDLVIGVGAPAGMVHSAAFGNITYMSRSVPVTDGVSRILFTDMECSDEMGTFLLNLDGELIGWSDNTLKGDSPIEADAVMSISDYKGILERLTNGQEVPYFGVKGQEVKEPMQDQEMPLGVYILEAVSGGPAYEAGLQNGDIITSFGDHPVSTLKELSSQILSAGTGNTAKVTVMRRGRDGYTPLEYEVSLRAR